ncbi:MAG TPA: Fic family protein [Sunxiuqinia sp.]|nr:Fic family protein [Sunxiuqinia sp.]
MALLDNLEIATGSKQQIDHLSPLSPEMEKRIMQKFRLDWNYNSTNIEGNSLTYGETKALILFGQTAQAKPLRDHLEMTGHDEAIKAIEEVVNQERLLSEKFIRELHQLILKEPYQVDGITADGQPAKKWVKVGQYKTSPNHVKTKTGEIFYFSTPEETLSKMSDLLQWYQEKQQSNDDHPIVFATEFHYRFVRIHPFDDGNGRLARLLMNFILMQKGYPPAIIKTEEKESHYNSLQQADSGQLEFFFDYVCKQVNQSLELMLKGAQGEEIDEPDDLDKKLQLLKKRLGEDTDSKVKVKRSPEAIKKVIEESIKPLLFALEKRLLDFDALSKDRGVQIMIQNRKSTGRSFYDLINNILSAKPHQPHSTNFNIPRVEFSCTYSGIIKSRKNLNFVGLNFGLFFHPFIYELRGTGIKYPIHKRYDDRLSEDDINKIVTQLGTYLYNVFEENIAKSQE